MSLARFWWTVPSQVGLAYGPVLWTSRPALSSETKSYLLRESAGTHAAIAFGDTGAVTVTALNTAGASISASGTQFTYYPYHDGAQPAPAGGARAGARSALSAGDGQEATAPRSCPLGADPHLDSVRTVHRR
ncbi:hypothetical protein [Streptomyces ziwulingensis]|uniref:Uncharacterized protein n=1 Tax=Streptomyces ziwulingensis TaxID=1045501 RepID=A0ABP9CEI6_9ACTN